MSGTLEECSCPKTHCLGGNCKCFKAKQFSSPNCTCNGCQNTENNKAAVDSKYNVYLKWKAPVVDEYLSVPQDGFPTPEGSNGCRCKKTKCMRLCGCLRRFAKSTSNCTCQDCANRGSDTKIELEQVDTNSSMAKEPTQMQEQPTQSGDSSGSGQNKRPRTGYTASSVFRMSGSWPVCSSPQTHCLGGNCKCFKAKQFCSPSCMCNGCQNTENNKAAVDSRYKVYLKRKAPVVDEYLSVPLDGFLVPEVFNGCKCKGTRCAKWPCHCLGLLHRCTSKCKCRDCAKSMGLSRSDKNTKPKQACPGGVRNMPVEAVQTKKSSNIKPVQAHDTRSIAEIEEQSTQDRDNMGSDQKKRARFKGYRLGSNNIRGGVMKLVGMAVLFMLLTVASAGRTEPSVPLRAASNNHDMSAVSGCTPKMLARDLVILCRETPNTPMHIEACCGAAVGTCHGAFAW